jgi:crossover junction endodeoxyribonuclease RuvC
MTIILGIDPGSRITGYGLIREHQRKLSYVDSGCIRTTVANVSVRLLQIFDGICELMQRYSPDEVVIESIFMHENASSALKLGQARGAALVAAASFRVAVSEYSPREVKQAIVGYGGAEKDQVKHMVTKLLGLNRAPQTDASDALALAICHSHQRHFNQLLKRVET